MLGKVQATMIEKLDGLPFAFGAKSFRQAGRLKWEVQHLCRQGNHQETRAIQNNILMK
jgi:hypothetical protein